MGFTWFEDLRYECRMVEQRLLKFAKSAHAFAAKLVFCPFFNEVELLQYGVQSLFSYER